MPLELKKVLKFCEVLGKGSHQAFISLCLGTITLFMTKEKRLPSLANASYTGHRNCCPARRVSICAGSVGLKAVYEYFGQ